MSDAEDKAAKDVAKRFHDAFGRFFHSAPIVPDDPITLELQRLLDETNEKTETPDGSR